MWNGRVFAFCGKCASLLFGYTGIKLFCIRFHRYRYQFGGKQRKEHRDLYSAQISHSRISWGCAKYVSVWESLGSSVFDMQVWVLLPAPQTKRQSISLDCRFIFCFLNLLCYIWNVVNYLCMDSGILSTFAWQMHTVGSFDFNSPYESSGMTFQHSPLVMHPQCSASARNLPLQRWSFAATALLSV